VKLKSIKVKDFILKPFDILDNQWMLLTSGDYNIGTYNTMTVGWGSFGIMWNKPFVQVVVRPTRYTYEFMEKYPSFTLTAFPEKYKNALEALGTLSGRHKNKIKKSGLTPIPSKKITSPAFKEAELIIECKKIYWDNMKPENFLVNDIENNYPTKDYHSIYFGEILCVNGINKYKRSQK